MIIVAVGSTNPAKIRAATNAFQKAFAGQIRLVPLQVESGVSDQPKTDKEAFQGALNRAKNAQRKIKADYGVGIEGGIQKHKYGVFSNAWIAVVDKQGKVGRGTSARFQLPNKIIRQMASGDELGVAIDKLVSGRGTKRRGGAYSALTAGRLSRAKAYEQGIICALMPFLTPKYWR